MYGLPCGGSCKWSVILLVGLAGCHPANEKITSSFTANTASSSRPNLLQDYKASIGSLAFSADGKKLATGAGAEYQFEPGSGEAKLWDVETGRELASWDGLSGRVRAIGFSPNGKVLAIAYSELTKTGAHGGGRPQIIGMIKIWDLERNREITTLKDPEHRVRRIAFSRNGKTLAISPGEFTITIWDLAKLKKTRSFTAHHGSVGDLAYSPDGATLASGGGEVIRVDKDTTKPGPGILKIWNPETGELKKTIKAHKRSVSSLAYLPDGKSLVTGSHDKTIKIWDLETGTEVRTMLGHSEPVWEVAISPDGKKVVSSSYDRTVRLWDLETGKELFRWQHMRGVTGLAFSPNGKLVAAGVGGLVPSEMESGEVRLWEVETGKEVTLPR